MTSAFSLVRPLVAIIAALVALAVTPSAFASTVTVNAGVLTYTGGNDSSTGGPEANNVQIDLQSGGYHISESGDAAIEPVSPSLASQCVGGSNDVVCNASGITSIKVDVGGGDDTVNISSTVQLPTVLLGGPGADTLTGGPKANTIDGGDGSDSIAGQGGDDTLIGGAGDDTIIGGGGNDSLDGGPGNDTLKGGDGNDTLIGGDGNDDMQGEGGDDTLEPGYGADVISGGDGRDTVTYADHTGAVNIDINNNPDDGEPNEGDDVRSDNEVIIGGSGDDHIAGDDNANTLIGGPGNDTLLGRGGNDTLDGGAGDDTLNGGPGADDMHGGDGNDSVTYAGRTNGVNVTLDDVANDGEPSEGDNVHTDVEQIYGGAGDDTLIGDDSRNFISGLDGNDVIEGRGGDDVLNGGAGADTISGGDGSDIVDYFFHQGPISVSYDGVANDGGAGEGDNLASDIEGVIGTMFDDRFLGGPGNDFIYAFGGNDTILGGPGTDTIVAGDGDDHIDSVDGTPDFVSCGDGNDSVIADAVDSVSSDCETKVIGPAVLVTTQAVVRLASTGIAVPLTCQQLVIDGCNGTFQLQATVPVPPRRPAKSKRKPTAKPKAKPKTRVVTLGTQHYSLTPGQTSTFTVPLPPGFRALVPKTGVSVTATVTNTDSAGSVTNSQGQFVAKLPVTKKPAKRKRR